MSGQRWEVQMKTGDRVPVEGVTDVDWTVEELTLSGEDGLLLMAPTNALSYAVRVEDEPGHKVTLNLDGISAEAAVARVMREYEARGRGRR